MKRTTYATTNRTHDDVHLRSPDQRGVHRNAPAAAERQRAALLVAFTLTTEPHDEVLLHVDRFGNDVRHFDVLHPHQRLMVTATSEVLTPETLVPDTAPLTPLDEFDYLMPTSYAPFTANLVQFAAAHVVPDDPAATAQALMHALYTSLKYEKGATDVTTTADQALDLGRGVCQDFAHIMMAACRSQGLPARYVSGYLYNSGQDGASHAWVDVYVAGHGGCRSIPRTTARRPASTCASPSAATTPMCRPPAASSRGTRKRRWM